MRRSLVALFLFLLFLSFCLQGRTPSAAQGERLVLAFYYAWYDQATWGKGLPDLPAQPYASTDPAAIERHVLWAKRAGIDGFVQSWYGPRTQNNQTESNFALLLDIAARHGFFAAVDLEVTSPFIGSVGDVVAALRHALAVHAAHPAYLRVGGRPVVFFWRQQRFPVETWEAIRQEVDPERRSLWIAEGTALEYLRVFDGNHLYSVAWSEAPEGVLTRWGKRVRDWGLQNGRAPLWVATVMPGYDDRATGRADAFVRDRAGGEYYRRCWQGAIASGADWVIITSFNEWMEGTQIEPSVGYGESYLDLTRELAGAFRAAPASAPPQPLTAPSLSPTPMSIPPTPTATPASTAAPSPTPTPSPTTTATPSPTATFTPPPPTPTPTATSPPPSPTPYLDVPATPSSPAEPRPSARSLLERHASWISLGMAALLALWQGARRRFQTSRR
ncbi:MAG: glycoside hydrolase family 99-like domain-containing protein [Anaerolineae bacterium]|nr:glycoside hydrolase family 99-like domain-containing protein [Anaerolineae bacterium]